ncbi:MAG: exopolysaccharide biosynthesis polyprenyl glycosylphosphotransferase [Candidatus Taylorbacteria bacterium]
MFGELIKRHKLGIAFLGDVAVFILSILAILFIRYGGDDFAYQFSVHREPFFLVLILWIIIFYIANQYTFKAFGNIINITKSLTATLLVSFSVTIGIFYIFSRYFALTPKANLIMLTIVFCILDITWRYLLRKVFLGKAYHSNILILSSSPLVKEMIDHVKRSPQLGYSIYQFDGDISSMNDTIQRYSITKVVIDGKYLRNNKVTKMLYSTLSKQIEISTVIDFYESLFGCIPLSEIEEEWFLREITENKSIYESLKRVIEILIICLTLPITIPVTIIIGILVAFTSSGPIIYRQERMGKNDEPFTLYKFRTMKIGQDGPLWTREGDERITTIGKFLRFTHLDEMPQLFNCLKGDISFVGPRPERTELVKIYEQIPYYEIRHIIKPGIIGWAQLSYRPSSSLDEAKQKFQFDLYYMKNRSLALDLFIFLKTARMMFMRNR